MKLKDALAMAAAIILIPGGSIIVPLYLYKKSRDKKKQQKSLDELVAESERLGLYDELDKKD
jgi:hypothetical protein